MFLVGVSNKVSSFLAKNMLLLFILFHVSTVCAVEWRKRSIVVEGEGARGLSSSDRAVCLPALFTLASRLDPGFLTDTTLHLYRAMANSWARFMPVFYC